jgi:hypothetical protein
MFCKYTAKRLYTELIHLRKSDKKHRIKNTIQMLSNLLKSITETSSQETLQLIINEDNDGVECVVYADGTQKRLKTMVFLADYHIRLQTLHGCDYAVVGMSTMENIPHGVELITETLRSQRRKGYNKLMRAIAIVVGFVDEKILYSNTENPISAMIQLKSYICDISFDLKKNQYISHTNIRNEKYIDSIYKDVKIIRLDPHINIDRSINTIITWCKSRM